MPRRCVNCGRPAQFYDNYLGQFGCYACFGDDDLAPDAALLERKRQQREEEVQREELERLLEENERMRAATGEAEPEILPEYATIDDFVEYISDRAEWTDRVLYDDLVPLSRTLGWIAYRGGAIKIGSKIRLRRVGEPVDQYTIVSSAASDENGFIPPPNHPVGIKFLIMWLTEPEEKGGGGYELTYGGRLKSERSRETREYAGRQVIKVPKKIVIRAYREVNIAKRADGWYWTATSVSGEELTFGPFPSDKGLKKEVAPQHLMRNYQRWERHNMADIGLPTLYSYIWRGLRSLPAELAQPILDFFAVLQWPAVLNNVSERCPEHKELWLTPEGLKLYHNAREGILAAIQRGTGTPVIDAEVVNSPLLKSRTSYAGSVVASYSDDYQFILCG